MNVQAFDWQLPGKIVVIDNNSELLMQQGFHTLMETGAFAVVAFDPSSRVENPERFDNNEDVQLFRHAVLGSGEPGTLYACLDAGMTSTLTPLPADQLPAAKQWGAKVLTQLPINTIALDTIEGLESLDWLILADNTDALSVLEQGTNALANTLLIQATVVFQPTHSHQADLMQLSHWAARHGFRFYRLNHLNYISHFPDDPSLLTQQATELASAKALFIPSRERMAALNTTQLTKLSFLLHTVYGAKDLAYEVLAQLDPQKAQAYLYAEGFTLSGALPSSVASAESFSAASEQWLASADESLETELEESNAGEDAEQEDIPKPELSFLGELEKDLEALERAYPTSGSPLREPAYVLQLLDSLQARTKFTDGYRLLDYAVEAGLERPDQLKALIYWREAQIHAQQSHWLKAELREQNWQHAGEQAAHDASGVEDVMRLRAQGALEQVEAWLSGYLSILPDCPLANAEEANLRVVRGEPINMKRLLPLLEQQSDNPEVAAKLALWRLNAQKPNEALGLVNRLDSTRAEVAIVKARILLKLEKLDEALAMLEQVPIDHFLAAEANDVKARIFKAQKNYDQTVLHIMRSLFAQPAYQPGWEMLADHALIAKALKDQAYNIVDMLAQFGSHHSSLYRLLIKAYSKDQAWRSALQWARKAVHHDPENKGFRHSLVQILTNMKDWPELRLASRQAAEMFPKDMTFTYHLGLAEQELENIDKAVQLLGACYKTSPFSKPLYEAYAKSLMGNRQNKKAISVLERVPEKERSSHTYTLLAVTHQAMGDYERSAHYFERCLALEPEKAETHFNYANTLFKRGELEKAWKAYEWGFEAGQRNPVRKLDIPLWDGQPVKEGKLLVWYEQGLGDEIMFGSVLKDLDRPGCNIIFQCRARLAPLFERSFEHIELMPVQGELFPSHKKTGATAHVPLGTLASYLRQDVGNFPDLSGFLKADEARVTHWRDYFESRFGKDKTFVGVSWSGGASNLKKIKTYFGTKKENFMPLFEVEGVVYISLMYHNVTSEIESLQEQGADIYQAPDVDMKNDLEEVSALTKALDLVITTENFPFLHSGALGVECWLLTNKKGHYYMTSSDQLLWFRDIKLFYVERPDNSAYIQRQVGRLAGRLRQRVSQQILH